MTKRYWTIGVVAATLALFGVGPAAFAAQAAAATQNPEDATAKANQKQARDLMEKMIDALGGDSWEGLRDWEQEGRTSYFEHGNPTGQVTLFWAYHLSPAQDRIVFGKKKDVFQLFTATAGYEKTYKGRVDLPKELVADFLRRRAHSVEVVARVWLKQPGTVLIYNGQAQVQRHLADKITIFSPGDESVTLELDAATHLPLRRTFQWRNPVFHDKDEDVEEYDDYHEIQGFPTPFTVTRYKDGDMVSQRFLLKGSYNTGLPPGMFDPDHFGDKRW